MLSRFFFFRNGSFVPATGEWRGLCSDSQAGSEAALECMPADGSAWTPRGVLPEERHMQIPGDLRCCHQNHYDNNP